MIRRNTIALALVAALSGACVPAALADSGLDAAPPAAVEDASAVAEPTETAPSTEPATAPVVKETAPSTEPATAPVVNPAEADPVATAIELYSAVKAGKWLVAGGLGMLMLVAFFRWLIGRFFGGWAKTKRGGYVISIVSSTLVSIGVGWAAGLGALGVIGSSIALHWTSAGALELYADLARWLGRKLG